LKDRLSVIMKDRLSVIMKDRLPVIMKDKLSVIFELYKKQLKDWLSVKPIKVQIIRMDKKTCSYAEIDNKSDNSYIQYTNNNYW
jgi:hypothetical protein